MKDGHVITDRQAIAIGIGVYADASQLSHPLAKESSSDERHTQGE